MQHASRRPAAGGAKRFTGGGSSADLSIFVDRSTSEVRARDDGLPPKGGAGLLTRLQRKPIARTRQTRSAPLMSLRANHPGLWLRGEGESALDNVTRDLADAPVGGEGVTSARGGRHRHKRELSGDHTRGLMHFTAEVRAAAIRHLRLLVDPLEYIRVHVANEDDGRQVVRCETGPVYIGCARCFKELPPHPPGAPAPIDIVDR